MPVILGIETSCDETACAIVVDGRKVLASSISSQIETHKVYGGVVPEVAARQHVQTLSLMLEEVLSQANVGIKEVDAIACTRGPGLIGTLLVGLSAAKALAWAHALPLLSVDHLLAHVCANYIDTELQPPFTALLVSGGHTQILHLSDFKTAAIIGQTLDDAAGEAYDKVGRLLGLDYPAGPQIDKLAASGDPTRFRFPIAKVPDFNFSFSGLKTAVMRCLEKLEKPYPLNDLAASFQYAVVESLLRKTMAAQRASNTQAIVLAGGVAANSSLRKRMKEEANVPVYYPAPQWCTDNAAMVAAAANFVGEPCDLFASPYARKPGLSGLMRR